MATINDVAKIAGVSIATVSRVVHNKDNVSDACRARVKKIIAELNYRPNRNASALAGKTTNTIGVVTPKLSMPFFGSLASGVEKAARDSNFKLLMSNSLYETETELAAIESLREHNCKAIVLHSEYSDEEALIKLANEIKVMKEFNNFKFSYQIHSWIVSLYVNHCVNWQVSDGCPNNPAKIICPSIKEISDFDNAVKNGDIYYTDSPFNINAEAVGNPMFFEAMTKISNNLDKINESIIRNEGLLKSLKNDKT